MTGEQRRIAWTGKTAVEIIDGIQVVGPETFPCVGRCGARNEVQGTLCKACMENAVPWVYERLFMVAVVALLILALGGFIARTIGA